MEKFGETRRGWLGVRIQNVDDAIADSLGLGKARGALIAGIDDKGPAKSVRPQDRRRDRAKFDGKDVPNIARPAEACSVQPPVGKDVEVVVLRKWQGSSDWLCKLGRLEDGEKQASLDTKSDATKPVPRTCAERRLACNFLRFD